MENWKSYYESHMMSVEDAAKLIESGDRMWVGATFSVPMGLLNALADRYEELDNVMILSNMLPGMPKMWTDEKYRKAFRSVSYYPNKAERMAFDKGLLEYGSIPYGYIYDSVCNVYKTNVVAVECCEPDENGMVNIGSFATFMTGAMMHGQHVTKCIAVVNKNHKPVRGPNMDMIEFPVTKFAAFCRSDTPLVSITESAPEEVDKQIAAHIMKYVRDGDVVQVGKGGLGNAIGFELESKKDMVVYTEIVSDWVMTLAEKGCLKSVLAGGGFGTAPLYDFLADSPLAQCQPIPKLATPDAVAQFDNFVGINSCMMADLTGQACSEGSGAWQYSSVGGQLEFVKGCNKIRMRGGRGLSFLALRSTRVDKEGKLRSNIVVDFPPASTVTTPRGEVMYYATEYGVVDLWGKTINDRVRAMISIAHPQFREELKQKSIAIGLMKPADFE